MQSSFSHEIVLPKPCQNLFEPIGAYEVVGAFVSGLFTTILTTSPVVGILAAGVSLLASRVDRFVTPLLRDANFLKIFDLFGSFTSIVKLILKTIVVLTLANYILAAATAFIGVAIEIDILFGLFISLYISIRLGDAKTDPFQPTSEGKPYLMILG